MTGNPRAAGLATAAALALGAAVSLGLARFAYALLRAAGALLTALQWPLSAESR